MGSEYAKLLLGKENPTVGLLNIGEEETKGNEQVLSTYPLLQQLKTVNFIGNVEGRDIPRGTRCGAASRSGAAVPRSGNRGPGRRHQRRGPRRRHIVRLGHGDQFKPGRDLRGERP